MQRKAACCFKNPFFFKDFYPSLATKHSRTNYLYKRMIKQFVQKRGLNYRKHTLYEDKVVVESRTIRKIDRYEIKLDQLGADKHYQADNTMSGKIAVGIFAFMPVILFISSFFQPIDTGTMIIDTVLGWSIALILYLKPHADDIYLVGGSRNLVFYRAVPNENEVLDFIDLIVATSRQYLKTKYASFDADTTEEEFMMRLSWLRSRGIITAREMESLKEDFQISRLLL